MLLCGLAASFCVGAAHAVLCALVSLVCMCLRCDLIFSRVSYLLCVQLSLFVECTCVLGVSLCPIAFHGGAVHAIDATLCPSLLSLSECPSLLSVSECPSLLSVSIGHICNGLIDSDAVSKR